jgi:hypothetical protein
MKLACGLEGKLTLLAIFEYTSFSIAAGGEHP